MRRGAMQLFRRAGSVFGADDVFVSYSRRDAADYALALSSELSARGYSCFLDQRLNEPGRELGPSVVLALSQCSMMVLIASPCAAESRYVEQEIALFLGSSRRRPMSIIDVDGTIEIARWRHSIEGTHRNIVSLDELVQAAPRKDVIDRIVTAATFMRRNQRLSRIGGALSLLIVGLALASTLLFRQVKQRQAEAATLDARATEARAQAEQAQRAREVALAEGQVARRERDSALTQRRAAVAERAAAEAAAIAAKREAEEQEGIAVSREQALKARQLSAYAPELALAAAVRAFERARTREAEQELVRAYHAFEPFVPLSNSKELKNIAFNRDRSVVAASEWGPQVWALEDGRLLGSYHDGNGLNDVVGFSHDNRLILAGYDSLVTWDMGSKEPPSPIASDGYAYPHFTAISDDNTLMALWSEGFIRVQSLDGNLVSHLSMDPNATHGDGTYGSNASIRFVPNSRRIVAITSKGELLLFDPDSKKLERQRLEGLPAGKPAIRRRGDLLTVAVRKGESEPDRGELWQLSPLRRLSGVGDDCGGPVYAFSDDDTVLAVSDFKKVALCTEVKPNIWIETASLQLESYVSALSFSSADKRLLVQTSDAILLYDLATKRPESELRGRPHAFSGSMFVPGDSRVLTWGPDGARLWSPRPRSRRVTRADKMKDSFSNYLSPDGKTVASGSIHRSLWLLDNDLAPFKLLAERGDEDRSRPLAPRFDPTSTQLAIAGGKTPVVWNTRTWEMKALPALNDSELIATDAAARTAVVSGRRGTMDVSAIEIWDLKSDRLRGELLPAGPSTHTPPVFDLALSADGGIVVASSRHKLLAWDVGSKRPFLEVADPDEWTKWVALTFDRTGRLLAASNSRTKAVTVWALGSEANRRTAVASLSVVEPETISALAFSADSKWLAASTQRQVAKVWRIDDGALVWSGPTNGPESAIAFESDSRRVRTLGQGLNLTEWGLALVSEDCFTCRDFPELMRQAQSDLKRARIPKAE